MKQTATGHKSPAGVPGRSARPVHDNSPQTIDPIFEVQSNGIDLVISIPFKVGVGYGLLPEGRVCAWGGAGGSSVIIDVDRRITFAYVMNKMAAGAIAWALVERVYDIVKR